MRLQKFMAEAGVDSRRKCELLIEQGRVQVNGTTALLGCSVDPQRDIVTLDGKVLTTAPQRIALVFNKPQGVMCTAADPAGRPTVMDYMQDLPGRVFSAGRLDYDSEGLLVMTNDGELAYRLTHPKFNLNKTYSVICDGVLEKDAKTALEAGVLLEDGLTAPAKVTEVHLLRNGNTALNITIHEGRNRQVRRMLNAVGHETLMLRRVALGPIRLGNLPIGAYRPLTMEEQKALSPDGALDHKI